MSLQDLAKAMLDNLVLSYRATGFKLTGEKDLKLDLAEFANKVEEWNADYLKTIIAEKSLLIRQGLMSENTGISGIPLYIRIPDWDSFIVSVDAYHVVNNTPDPVDKENDYNVGECDNNDEA